MLNDVVFNNQISAYDDWNIVLTKAEIPFPTAKTSTVDIKGADGLIDLSEVTSGDIKYNNRTIKLTFEMLNDKDYDTLMSEIGNYLHGKNIKFTFTNDDDYYYMGRATISNWECIKRKGKIVLTINSDPYKYLVMETVINLTLNNQTKSIVLPNSRKKVSPTLTVTGNLTLIYNDVEYPLNEGTQQVIGFQLQEGANVVKFRGTGTVKIQYRQECL